SWIPAGRFLMGSPETEPGRYANEVQHRVALTRGFWLATAPVTQVQWQAVMGSSPSLHKGYGLPVETVSWEDCGAFCRRWSERTGERCRLPTEGEGEYACRAGTTTAYHFGQTLGTAQANFGRRHGSWCPDGILREQTTRVGRFPPNAWGLHDLHGNVWE